MIPSKKKIDLSTYPRRGLFEAFKDRRMPCFGVTANVDITRFRRFCKTAGYSFYISVTYLIARAVNRTPEFRHRLIDGELYEFERVDPSHTVLMPDNTFSFCDSVYTEDFMAYHDDLARRIEAVRKAPDLENRAKDHMFFITDVPWISFTSITHPFELKYSSIPAIAIGRYFDDGGRTLMPLAIQAHHGLADGYHLGLFYDSMERMLREPDGIIRKA
jgi:chloramphenicol O-acetyltransferase type A